jgi:hypothetical protein
MLEGLDSQSLSALHLAVSVRSFRAEKLSKFVRALVTVEADEAKQLYQTIKTSYPIVLPTPGLGTAVASRSCKRFGAYWSCGVVRRVAPQARRDQRPGKDRSATWFLTVPTQSVLQHARNSPSLGTRSSLNPANPISSQ